MAAPPNIVIPAKAGIQSKRRAVALDPRFRVVSREIGESFGRSAVSETSQSRAIVVVDEGEDIAVTLGTAGEAAVMAGGIVGHAPEVLGNAAVETLDHTVGLRPEGPRELVGDIAARAEAIDRMLTRGSVVGFAFLVDRKAIGPLAAVIREDGVDRGRELGHEAFEESGGESAVAALMDLEIDEAGSAIDGDEGVGRLAFKAREVFEIDMDEAGGRVGIEDLSRIGLLRRPAGDTVALEAAVNAAARELRVHTSLHHLDNVIEGEGQALAQFDHQALFFGRQVRRDPMRPVRAIVDAVAAAPASDRVVTDTQLADEFGGRRFALLDVSPFCWRRGRQLMKLHHHPRPPWRALARRIPANIAGRSRQSRGTQHESGGDDEKTRRERR
jgi:hypothetical protein